MTIKHKRFNLNVLSTAVVVIILGSIGVKLIFTSHASQLLPGDANSDGTVNISDLAILASHYGTKTGATWSMGDFNADGAVNIEDLSVLAAHWGDTQSVATPTISLTALPTTVIAGSNSTITWSTTGATSCTASGAWSGSKAVSGSVSTSIFDSPSSNTYSLDCTGTGGSTSTSVIITVTGTSLVTTGDSKSNCIEYNQPNGDINDAQLTALTTSLGVTYNCVITYNNPMATWAEWDTPWMFTGGYGWNSWVAESTNHQVILGEDLIPSAVENNSDPLTWEQQCDAGDFNSYATALGDDLVSEGAPNTIIRLGIEANGTWEVDFVGTTTQEQNAWAQCYDNEVTALRAVPNAHFLFVWNPNICTQNLPLNEWYPGNSYVDIIGADAYDEDCYTQQSVSEEGWSAYANDSSVNTPNNSDFPSLNNIEAFAAANGKAFSLPEWGFFSGLPDDPTYVTDMGNMVKDDNTSFQAWFDCGCDSTTALGSTIPLSTTAYEQEF